MLFLFTLVAIPLHATAAGPLPEACQTGCVTPYGMELGAAAGPVQAYSNCSPACISLQANRVNGTYTGMKWQCVEFARRWLLQRRGVVYGDVDVAADIWNRIDYVTRIADNTRIPFKAHPNGAARPPARGDLLVYARAYLDTGHVAVIISVDPSMGVVRVAEQNYDNGGWPAGHARSIRLVQMEGRFWLLDPYVLGWKRLSVAAPAAQQ